MPLDKIKDAMPTIPESERCEKCFEADGNHFVLCPEAGYDFSYDVRLQQAADDAAKGMTMAYRSPEQAKGLRLTPGTDQWSWGVSVLHMLAGEVHWRYGEAASRRPPMLCAVPGRRERRIWGRGRS